MKNPPGSIGAWKTTAGDKIDEKPDVLDLGFLWHANDFDNLLAS